MSMSSRDTPMVDGPVLAGDDPYLFLPQRVDEPIVWLPAVDKEPDQPADWGERLAVFVGRADSYHGQQLPVAGRYEHDGEILRLRPAFGFVAGQDYVVRTQRKGEPHRFTDLHLPLESVGAPAVVTSIYPSGEVLPENTLRFYVHFSVPMTPHLASDYIRLRDALGVADDAAFMRFKQELWNDDRTRLTVLIDPGRIKRSVATKLELGPALVEGQRYALTVDEGWPCADGSSVLPSFSKSFSVGKALRERPDISRWKWSRPQPGTHDALEITLDRPFDRHLLTDAVRVAASDGRTIDGTPLVGEHETFWSFTPREAWTESDLRVTVDDALEDVAGNNLRELLDTDVNVAKRVAVPRD